MTIDGKKIADDILGNLRTRLEAVAEKGFFGAVLVGDHPASRTFLAQKKKVADMLGIEFRLYELAADISLDILRDEIGRLASPKTCGAFIVQLPLPERLTNTHYALNAIPKEKDPDLLSEAALGAFYTGRHELVPPSVAALQEVLAQQKVSDLRERTVAVIGAGFLIGKPVGFWLQNRVGELMVFDKESPHMLDDLARADIVISGAGTPGLFSAKNLAPNALVIDFGYGTTPAGKLAGDFDPTGAEEKNIVYTKTPGGTGPILVAKLFENYGKLIGA